MSAEKSFWSVMLSLMIVAACAQSGGRTGGSARTPVDDEATQEEDKTQESTCEETALVNGESTSNCDREDTRPTPEPNAESTEAVPPAPEPDSGLPASAPTHADAGQPSTDDDADQEDAAVRDVDEEDEERADKDEDEDEDEDVDEDVDEDADEQADEDADQDEDQDEEQEEQADDSDDDADEQRVA